MSDEAYDLLESRLKQLNPSHPALHQVGAAPRSGSSLPKARHTHHMGSLAKAQVQKR